MKYRNFYRRQEAHGDGGIAHLWNVGPPYESTRRYILENYYLHSYSPPWEPDTSQTLFCKRSFPTSYMIHS
jgi:hypothetical protein